MPTDAKLEKNIIEIVTSTNRSNWEKEMPGITKSFLLKKLRQKGITIDDEELDQFLKKPRRVVGVRRNGQVFVGGLTPLDFGDFLELIERVLERHESRR